MQNVAALCTLLLGFQKQYEAEYAVFSPRVHTDYLPQEKTLYIPEFCVTQDRLTISGQVNFSSHLRSEGDLDMIVVVFHPHAMSAFLNVPTSLFYNIETSGYNLEDRSLNELTEQIFDSKKR